MHVIGNLKAIQYYKTKITVEAPNTIQNLTQSRTSQGTKYNPKPNTIKDK